MTVTGTPGQTGKNLQSNGNRSQFYQHQLSNGLQILGERMPDFESVAVAFHVRTGARDEPDPRVFGVSHFLEHMVFKGTQKRSAEEISLEIGHARTGDFGLINRQHFSGSIDGGHSLCTAQ